MATLLDELAGVLSAEEIAKIKANPRLSGRMDKVRELEALYYGEDEPVVTPPAVVTPPPAVVTPPPAAATGDDVRTMVSGILKRLDTVVTSDKIEEVVTKTVEKLAPKFIGAAAAQGTRNADELNRIYIGHKSEFAEDFDSQGFNTFIETQQKAGIQYRSVTDAYNDMVKDKRVETKVKKGIEEGVREGLKRRVPVPGTTPQGTKSPLSVILARGRPTDSTGATAAESAGADLEARLARANSVVM